MVWGGGFADIFSWRHRSHTEPRCIPFQHSHRIIIISWNAEDFRLYQITWDHHPQELGPDQMATQHQHHHTQKKLGKKKSINYIQCSNPMDSISTTYTRVRCMDRVVLWLTLREMKGSFLWSPVAMLTGTNSNSSSFSLRQTIALIVAVDITLPCSFRHAMTVWFLATKILHPLRRERDTRRREKRCWVL